MANSNGAFPELVIDIGPSTGRIAPAGVTPLGQIVENALRDVLGWRPKVNDPKGFVAALNQSFSAKEQDGQMKWSWIQRSYSVQADIGAITGAQASIYQQAKVALEQILPLLEGLYPLKVDADPQEMEAARKIIRSKLIELVNELGVEGGPRVQRVDDCFRVLVAYDPTNPSPTLTSPDTIGGQLGELREEFGLESDQVNTIEEEQNLTNFYIIVSYVETLRLNWDAQKSFFDRTDTDVFLGTQAVLLSRQLAVIAESVQEVYFAMDSVFLGAAERQTTFIEDSEPPITIAELLDWVERFASEEGPQLIQEAGKNGVRVVEETLTTLAELVELLIVAEGD